MLIRFSFENWMSFRNRAEFSMLASQERKHNARLARIRKYPLRLLPIAAIYGANAAGKSNFFKALEFARNLVVNGTRPDKKILVEPFCLGCEPEPPPSAFHFELLINEQVYAYSFTVTREKVLEETLTEITPHQENILFHRHDNGDIKFETTLAKDQRLDFVASGTQPNKLFLTNAVEQRIDLLRPVYDWFASTLRLVDPSVLFSDYTFPDPMIWAAVNSILPRLDTGIASLDKEELPLKNMGWELLRQIEESLPEGEAVPLGTRFVIRRENGNLKAEKLISLHYREDGATVPMEISQESDGTLRALDLLPAFIDLAGITAAGKAGKVYVIDEIDRSLHTLLTRQLLEMYLSECSGTTRSQLIATTHDVLLMDQELLRRDEMWLTERDHSGATDIFSICEYAEAKDDRDLRKSYLQGRLGGIPKIFLQGVLNEPKKT